MILAYQTGAFSQMSKPKSLSFYLRQLRRGDGKIRDTSEMLHHFKSMQQRGVPMSIKRVN